MHNLFFHLLDFGSLLTTYIYRQVSDSSTCQLSYPTISHTAATIVGLEEKVRVYISRYHIRFHPLKEVHSSAPTFQRGLASLVNDQYLDRPPYSIFVYALFLPYPTQHFQSINISYQGRSMCLHIPCKKVIDHNYAAQPTRLRQRMRFIA